MAKLAGDHVQVLVDGYELTGDLNRVSIPDTRDLYDVTAFGDAVHQFIPGRRTVALEHAGYMNADEARSHPVLKASSVAGIVSVLLGQNTDPAAGDPAYSLAIRQGKYSVIPGFRGIRALLGAVCQPGRAGRLGGGAGRADHVHQYGQRAGGEQRRGDQPGWRSVPARPDRRGHRPLQHHGRRVRLPGPLAESRRRWRPSRWTDRR